MPSFVVTGASRGIGLGFVHHLCADPQNKVFALVRDTSKAKQLEDFINSESNKNKNVVILQADLADYKSIKSASAAVSQATGGTLDVLINNGALVHHERNALNLDNFPDEETLENDLITFFKTNVVGVTHTINAFLPLLRTGGTKRVLVVSSAMGSPQFALQTGYATTGAYSISKAGLNMVVAKFAAACKAEGFVFLTVSPGLVKTMPGPSDVVDKIYKGIVEQIRAANPSFSGAITVEQSVREQMALLWKTTPAESGIFLHSTGEDGNLVVGYNKTL